MPESVDPVAPHGRDADGVPLHPYGFRRDGVPKLSNRGRKVAAPPKKAAANTKAGPGAATRRQQKQALMEIADMLLTPAAGIATAPPLRKKLGEKRADAVAGSVVIVGSFAEDIADFTVHMAESRPGLLSWMDRMDDKLPLVMGAKILVGMGKALAQNWVQPDPQLAAAARKVAPLRAAQFAASISDQYAQFVQAGLIEDQDVDRRDYEEHEGAQMAAEAGAEFEAAA